MKDNTKGIRRVFQVTVKLASYFELVGGSLIAVGNTKFRVQNYMEKQF
jgi:hypothetical protein